jgi:4-azaleucine resistance transporter AzlC
MVQTTDKTSAAADGAAAPFTVHGVRRGVVEALPLAASVLVYGVVFGLLAKTAAMSFAEAMLMSTFVYSGSAQVVAVSAIEAGRVPTGAAAFAVMTTIVLLNARYLLYGAALHPWLGGVSKVRAYATLVVLGDGNWVLSMKAAREGEKDAGYVFGSGVVMFAPWLAGTMIGMLAGAFAADPRALGLDFMLVAFSAALMSGLLKGRSDVAVLLSASAAAIAADRLLPSGLAVLTAAAAGGLTGWLRFRREDPA